MVLVQVVQHADEPEREFVDRDPILRVEEHELELGDLYNQVFYVVFQVQPILLEANSVVIL